MAKTIWNRPLSWDEAEEHFPGCTVAWDIMASTMVNLPPNPVLMAVFKYDHVPCAPTRQQFCRICMLGGNDLQLTLRLSQHSVFTYDQTEERWVFSGMATY